MADTSESTTALRHARIDLITVGTLNDRINRERNFAGIEYQRQKDRKTATYAESLFICNFIKKQRTARDNFKYFSTIKYYRILKSGFNLKNLPCFLFIFYYLFVLFLFPFILLLLFLDRKRIT